MSNYQFTDELTPQQTHRINFSKFLSNHKIAIKNYTQRIIDRYTELENFRDFFSQPVFLNFQPPEVQRYDEIIQSENSVQKKCMVIFGNLITEMDYLSDICEKEFFPTLSIFGEKPEVIEENPPNKNPEEVEGEVEEEMSAIRERQFRWEMQLSFARLIDFLGKLWNFVERCGVVVKNVIQQMGMFFQLRSNNANEFKFFSRVQLHCVFYSLSTLLKRIICLDSIVDQNDMIKPQYQYYIQMLHEVEKNEEKFGVNRSYIGKLAYFLDKLNTSLLDGRVFWNLCFQNFNDLEKQLNVTGCASFRKIFFRNISQLHSAILEDKMDRKTDDIIGIFGLFCMYRNIWMDEPLDKKFMKLLFDTHQKIPIVHVYGNTFWTISMFAEKYLGKDLSDSVKNYPKELTKFAQKFFSVPFETKARKYLHRMSLWYSLIHSSFKNQGAKYMFVKEQQLVQGIVLSHKISSFIKTIIYFSIYNNRALNSSQITLICKLMQTLKEIQITIYDLSIKMGKFMSNVIENHMFQIQKYFIEVEKMIKKKGNKITETDLEELRTIQCCLNVLSGAPTQKRIIAARLAMDFCPKQYFGAKELKAIAGYVRRIRVISHYRSLLDRSSDCSFLYWNQGISLLFFKYIYHNSERAYQIPLIFLALEDCKSILEKAVHLTDREQEIKPTLEELNLSCQKKVEQSSIKVEEAEGEGESKEAEGESKGGGETKEQEDVVIDDNESLPDPSSLPVPAPSEIADDILPYSNDSDSNNNDQQQQQASSTPQKTNVLIESYRDSLLKTFDSVILNPLGVEIDQFLRLNVISNDTSNYDPSGRNIKNLEHFFSIHRIEFLGKVIDTRSYIKKFLEKTFYDYTTMQQTDWKIYEEMRNLFYDKFGIRLLDSYLPKQITHQGEDIIDVTKNIVNIVSTYSYNFNNNMFIQLPEGVEDRKLKTLLVRHVSNSIRTHGTGIMNTTVDFVFRYLKEKLFDFSRFLYDEYIHGRLVKDVRFFKDQHLELDSMYPVERAIDFAIKIKKLGVENGKTFLDKFRDLITKIGNALGYVRMLRAGGLKHVHYAVQYVPSLDDLPKFEEMLSKEMDDGFSEYTQSCGKTMQNVLENYTTRFEHGSDYFVKLEEAFSKLLNTEEHKHLESFYVIIPPLTVSFVEDMIYGKEQIDRRSAASKFTNDGFSLGVSFLLKVLKQQNTFASLNWFKSCEKYYQNERKTEINQQSALTRANVYLKEFKLLFYAFNCTKIFLY